MDSREKIKENRKCLLREEVMLGGDIGGVKWREEGVGERCSGHNQRHVVDLKKTASDNHGIMALGLFPCYKAYYKAH